MNSLQRAYQDAVDLLIEYDVIGEKHPKDLPLCSRARFNAKARLLVPELTAAIALLDGFNTESRQRLDQHGLDQHDLNNYRIVLRRLTGQS
ncbi:MAG: hypothetical protein AAGA67_01645 [Cyanobacteria bacterium P01_F01_bin.153]